MSTELTIKFYKDPSDSYKTTDDVYVKLAVLKHSYYVYVIGQITAIVHHPRQANLGSDWWEVKVVVSLDPDTLHSHGAPTLVHKKDEQWVRLVTSLQETLEEQRRSFSNIEEGYKRAIKTMMGKT